jgi:hypothetical protein
MTAIAAIITLGEPQTKREEFIEMSLERTHQDSKSDSAHRDGNNGDRNKTPQ